MSAMFPTLEQVISDPPALRGGFDLPDIRPMSHVQRLFERVTNFLDLCLTLLVGSGSWTKMSPSLLATYSAASGGVTDARAASCEASTFQSLSLPRIEVLSVDTFVNTTGRDFCQLTVHYTHPGQNDTVNTLIGLPFDWNERFQMIGGGGWATGYDVNLFAAVNDGYSSSTTDGGHDNDTPAAEWGLVSEGNINWSLFWNFAVDTLDEGAALGKLATELYYGTPPKYSYWTGCSTGGRQGHIMAQQHPEHFDGILAGAPAINWQRFVAQAFWGALTANLLGTCFHYLLQLVSDANGCRQIPNLLRVCWMPSLRPQLGHVMD